ncbi:MAG: 4-hydroxy-tetrahydrodipicolinate reductase [Thermovirgaceae bacterium]|nr:4-hydroxy-tetrahydrodipicolinate reductase [Thermovirgaceae bacterium]
MGIKVAVSGICGKTGALIAKKIFERETLTLICGFERPGHLFVGSDFGELIKDGILNVPIYSSDNFEHIARQETLDVVVDFTSASNSAGLVQKCAGVSVQVVMGTTGFSSQQQSDMATQVKNSGISMVLSSNYGIAANVMFKIVSDAAKTLGRYDFDVEIIDYHSRDKPDAPSGTAMALGKIVADAVGWDLLKVAKFGREHKNNHPVRDKKEIGFHSLRSGCVEGNGDPGIYLAENSIYFGGSWDRLDIAIHDYGMQAIVPGVLSAIEYLFINKNKANIFSMLDVLGLND